MIDSNVLKRMKGDEVAAFVETLERMFESDFKMAIVERGPSLGYVVGRLAEYLERYPENPLITGFLEKLIAATKNAYKTARKSVQNSTNYLLVFASFNKFVDSCRHFHCSMWTWARAR